ncbi:DUF3616 domain-containing protein [Pseudorhodoferax sp.]|uniref:DUF3616 domain-containing protein n=1 Tax=Pseudorhodoferax sp. TaxID=1993553 RepID=UPI002DD69021|nr:DUF3616 domain-containing protein [Pseudorhodoferax sp.]
MRAPTLRSLAIALALCCGLGAQAQVPRIAPTGGPWPAGAGFAFAKDGKSMRRSVSGIACGPDAAGRRVCLLAFDEGTQARFAQLGDGTLLPLAGAVELGTPGKELDAEGAATDGSFFYVTGSHAAKRSGCQANAASRYVLRFRRDAATGLAVPAAAAGLPGAGYQRSDRLYALLQADPALRQRLGPGGCLGQGGLDIEGLAVRGGRLYFGLRGPTEAGHAFVVSVDAEAFFGGGDAGLRLARVQVGERRGLRDMVATRDGILLLAGPDDVPAHAQGDWTLSLWDDGADPAVPPRPLAVLDLAAVALRGCDKETKPEAVTVLQESAQALRVLVLSDGMCDGGALAFDLPR